jgi:hypothetical protein
MKANPGYIATLMDRPEAEKKALLEGDWDAYDTGCAFDAKGLLDQEKMIRDPSWIGWLRDNAGGIEPLVDEKGPLSIWKRPITKSQYFIAADVAKGVEGGDNSVAGVFDRSNGELVAKYKAKIDPTEFGAALVGIGLYYNTAKIAVEVWPGPGIATGAELVRREYPTDCLYRRMVWDGEKHTPKAEIGWVTDERGRNDLVTAAQNAIFHRRMIMRDQEMLDEHRSFIRNERGRFEARSGSHDDHVIVFGIAAFCMAHDPVSELLDGKRGGTSVVGSVVRLPEPVQHGKLWRGRNGFK